MESTSIFECDRDFRDSTSSSGYIEGVTVCEDALFASMELRWSSGVEGTFVSPSMRGLAKIDDSRTFALTKLANPDAELTMIAT